MTFSENIYGKSIVIVRTINGNSGASTYKIKSENGRVISSSRNELLKLTLFMNIQVENPVLVLNQDASRSFLKECDPKKLFSFFMKATQIEAIIEKLNSSLKVAVTIKNNMEFLDKRIEQDEKEVTDLNSKLCLLQSVEKLKRHISQCK